MGRSVSCERLFDVCPGIIADMSATPLIASSALLSQKGLTADQIKRRRATYGWNELPEPKTPSLIWIFFTQLRAPFSLVLMAAVITSLFFNKHVDAIIIGAVILINATIGLLYEERANQALNALKQTFVPTCRVRRAGREVVIQAREVLPGDILLLNEGERVAADARLMSVHGLQVDESMLTGESIQVTKTDGELVLSDNAPLGDIRNRVFAGTLVVTGRGEAEVVAIGLATQMGKIASALNEPHTDTPLVAKMKRLSRHLLMGIAIGSIALFIYSLILGRPISMVLPMLLSLFVSVIPEGLPMVVTVVLARAVAVMAKKRTIVKQLLGVEGLNDVDVLCTDKTGTLTKNELVVHDIWKAIGVDPAMFTRALLQLAHGSNDPIERAFVAFALKQEVTEEGRVVEELPFDYKTRVRKRLVEFDGQMFA
ncbi:HAD-IC family P-type ATPase, partial [Candidatus Uhrbacteria bacterium]|nr:HAD-IC family P-type ATPase [Candidatus Uhrbacteria bacterium]